MKHAKATKYCIGLMVLAVAGWDVFVLVDGGTESSISYRIITWSYEFPAMTFAVGFIMGHLFWRMRDTKKISKDEK